MLAVPCDDFFLGVRWFLASFAQAVRREVPELVTWETFDPLRPHLDDSAPGRNRDGGPDCSEATGIR